MFQKKLILIYLCVIFTNLSAISYDPKGILIFIDDSEIKPIGYASGQLLISLLQKAGPIIASTSLLLVINQTAQLKNNETAKLKAANPNIPIFDPDEWVLKKIGNLLCLLIPKNYLQQKNISLEYVEKYDPSAISQTELTLGLKVNHMHSFKMADAPFMYARGDRLKNKDYFIRAIENSQTGQSEIFCTRSDYKGKNVAVPAWSMLISGHGYINETIAGITLQEFRSFLNFLDQKILTRFLLYRSCYAAGINNELIFKDSKSALYRTYSFAIATEAITDAGVENQITLNKVMNLQIASANQRQQFLQFLQEITRAEINFESAIESIAPLVSSQFAGNIPQIKLPGIEWFSVLASRKDVVSIGQVLSKTRQTSLNMIEFFKTNPQVLLLYAKHIPFEIVMNVSRLKSIISMVPGDAIHTLRKIITPYYTNNLPSWWEKMTHNKKNIADLLDLFMTIEHLATNKIFYIEELNGLKDVIINNVKISSDDDSDEKYERYGLFYDRGILYSKEFGRPAEPADEERKKIYEIQIKKIQEIQKRDRIESTLTGIEKIKELFKDKTTREFVKKRIEQTIEKIDERKKIEAEQKYMHIFWQALNDTAQKLYELSRLIYPLNKK